MKTYRGCAAFIKRIHFLKKCEFFVKRQIPKLKVL